jgi:hypothetical protein
MNKSNIHDIASPLKVDPSTLTVPHAAIVSGKYLEAATEWLGYGLNVIPVDSGTKKTAVYWDPWLDGLGPEKIRAYWSQHPDHELGFIIGDDVVVLDADSPESIAALAQLEEAFDVSPNLIVKTRKGQHHYFKLAQGAFARTDSHSTELFPERIDVKARRSMVILPPSTGKETLISDAENVVDLVTVGQDFIDAVFRHNGRVAPRPIELSTSVAMPKEASSQTVADIKAMLACLDPECGREDWVHVGMAIKYATGGSEEGFALWNAWSSKGKKYPGERELRAQWKTFRDDLANPITIGTIRNLVTDNGHDWMEVCAAVGSEFKVCEMVTLDPEQPSPKQPERKANPLDRFSLKGMSLELEKQTVEQVPILGKIALKGQATIFYAAPNTGKTLITLSLIIDGIAKRHIDPAKLYYLNMDDSGKGLLEKLRLAEEYGFHMLAEGHRDFKISEFLSIVSEMVEKDQCREVIIVLDTLKKFADLMDKVKASSFTKVIRRFVLKGGTLVALAHTNKNPGRDGKLVYSGTTDIIDDFDCAYTLAYVTTSDATKEKVVEFENKKTRGDVAYTAAYSYAIENGISYYELLLTVRPVDLEQLPQMKQAEQLNSDAEVIKAVIEGIQEGINTKMLLAGTAAVKAGISKRSALQLIEKYTGCDPTLHRWNYSVQERGAKVFEVLTPASAAPISPAANL